MNIAIIGANGKAGSLITKEAIKRGHNVTAIMRTPKDTPAQHTITKDVFDLTSNDLENIDIIIDAFGAWREEDLPKHATHLEHLANLLTNTPTRLLVVGGAGSLFLDPEHTTTLAQAPDFPTEYRSLALAMEAGLNVLRATTNVKWTYLSPAADFQATAPGGVEYTLAGEEFTTDNAGNSTISYADYARAMLDLAEGNAHIGERVSVRNA